MTSGEIAARKAVNMEVADDVRRREVEKWLAVQDEYATPRDVQWNELGIWFDVWTADKQRLTTKLIPWAEVQGTLVDHLKAPRFEACTVGPYPARCDMCRIELREGDTAQTDEWGHIRCDECVELSPARKP